MENDNLPEQAMMSMGKPLYQNSGTNEFIFNTLLKKFKKLRKTKEEMIKFCMRKAFKYASENRKNSKTIRSKKAEQIEDKLNCFEMPFRKNSSEKTMNAQFLKQVFSSPNFTADYQVFLGMEFFM